MSSIKLTLLVLLFGLLLISCTVQKQDTNFIHLFNKTDLTDWKGDKPYWRVENGILVGEITDSTIIDANRFIIYQRKIPSNFELVVDFRVSENGNSGINYRSEIIKDIDYKALRGYQYDIDGKMLYTGSNYEEKRRSTLASIGESAIVLPVEPENPLGFRKKNKWTNTEVSKLPSTINELKSNFKNNDWNRARIIAQENVLTHFLNGKLISKVIDNDTLNRKDSGFIGVQVHIGPPMKIEYKNIMLKKL